MERTSENKVRERRKKSFYICGRQSNKVKNKNKKIILKHKSQTIKDIEINPKNGDNNNVINKSNENNQISQFVCLPNQIETILEPPQKKKEKKKTGVILYRTTSTKDVSLNTNKTLENNMEELPYSFFEIKASAIYKIKSYLEECSGQMTEISLDDEETPTLSYRDNNSDIESEEESNILIEEIREKTCEGVNNLLLKDNNLDLIITRNKTLSNKFISFDPRHKWIYYTEAKYPVYPVLKKFPQTNFLNVESQNRLIEVGGHNKIYKWCNNCCGNDFYGNNAFKKCKVDVSGIICQNIYLIFSNSKSNIITKINDKNVFDIIEMINSDEHRNNPKILIVNHCAFVLPNILDTQLLYMLPISCEDIMTRYDISSNQQKINNGKINYYDILFIVKNKHDSCEINETEIYNLKKNDKKIIDSDYDHIKFPFIENITETKISIFGDCMTEEELTIFCHEKLSIKTVLTSCPRSNINNSTTDYISTDKKYEFIKIKEHNCCLLSRCVDSSNNAIINQKHTQKLQNTMNNSFNDSLITITPDISLSFPVIGISIQDVTENIHCDSSWIKNKYGTIIFN